MSTDDDIAQEVLEGSEVQTYHYLFDDDLVLHVLSGDLQQWLEEVLQEVETAGGAAGKLDEDADPHNEQFSVLAGQDLFLVTCYHLVHAGLSEERLVADAGGEQVVNDYGVG